MTALELVLDEEVPVPMRTGTGFIDTPYDYVKQELEKQSLSLNSRIGKIQKDLSANEDECNGLKTTLKSKFGDLLQLEK